MEIFLKLTVVSEECMGKSTSKAGEAIAGATIKHTEKMRMPAPHGKEFGVIN